ncbi:group XV phospholipase A2 [Elysia marginata]|uniref:Group XV phospholipase A2 n=1 Tax=Elysia marginata TaxID=1093978 RepID=A0AAV4JXQ7_9GAST|nr:group XV phospholipase A2 [Elysia marginata]
MSAGCNYYITVEDVQHTQAADRARLMLEATGEYETIRTDMAHHSCSACNQELDDRELLTLEDLPLEVDHLTSDEKMSLYHISGFIAFKENLKGEHTCHSADVKAYTDNLDRGGLRAPSESLQTMVAY